MSREPCGAQTRAGTPCRLGPVPNGRRCRLHGGAGLVGPANGNYKHGRYSRFLPTGLAARAADMATDSDLINLSHEIGIIDALTVGAMEGIDLGASVRTIAEMRTTLRQFGEAMNRGNTPGMREALTRLNEQADEAYQQSRGIEQLRDLLQDRRRLAEAERRRLEAIQSTLTVDKAYALAEALAVAIREHVHDPDTRRAISASVSAIVNRQPVL